MRDTYVISGNGGSLFVDAVTGRTITYQPSEEVEAGDHEGYGDILKVDLAEHFRFWGEDHRRFAQIDILDVGYWAKSEHGQLIYEGPELDWREMVIDEGYVTCAPAGDLALKSICL
ncbi:MAG: hypothetical protein P4M09_22895 [Devosia sp.]|nr:hypothetical protein [Devosia sp.]